MGTNPHPQKEWVLTWKKRIFNSKELIAALIVAAIGIGIALRAEVQSTSSAMHNLDSLDVSGFMVFVSVAAAISSKGGRVLLSTAYLFMSGFVFFAGYFFAIAFENGTGGFFINALIISGFFGVFIFGSMSIITCFDDHS